MFVNPCGLVQFGSSGVAVVVVAVLVPLDNAGGKVWVGVGDLAAAAALQT